jgi:hypothetical protein
MLSAQDYFFFISITHTHEMHTCVNKAFILFSTQPMRVLGLVGRRDGLTVTVKMKEGDATDENVFTHIFAVICVKEMVISQE